MVRVWGYCTRLGWPLRKPRASLMHTEEIGSESIIHTYKAILLNSYWKSVHVFRSSSACNTVSLIPRLLSPVT